MRNNLPEDWAGEVTEIVYGRMSVVDRLRGTCEIVVERIMTSVVVSLCLPLPLDCASFGTDSTLRHGWREEKYNLRIGWTCQQEKRWGRQSLKSHRGNGTVHSPKLSVISITLINIGWPSPQFYTIEKRGKIFFVKFETKRFSWLIM